MSEITANGRKERRPPCAKCGGTGYVYLWSVERARGRTWFCDRCKLSWLDTDSLAARVLAANISEAVGASPRLVGVDIAEPLVAPARTRAAVGNESLSAVGLD